MIARKGAPAHCDRIVIELQPTGGYSCLLLRIRAAKSVAGVGSCILLSPSPTELKIPRTTSPCRFESDLRYRVFNLSSLPRPGPYLLEITGSDGSTPEVSDSRIFEVSTETTIVLNRPHRSPPAPRAA